MMDGGKRTVKSQYRRFVEAGITDIDAAVIYAKQRSPLCIGSDDYVERVETQYHELADRRGRTEECSFTHQAFAIDQETVLSVVCDVLGVDRFLLYQRSHHNIPRSIAAQCLCKWAGCSQFEVGKILRIGNCSSVSNRLKHLRELLQTDKTTKKLQTAIDLALGKKQIKRSDP